MDNLFNRLIDLATVCPDKKAVVFKGEYLTYRELCRRIASMAEQLAKEGIEQGDRVCFSAVSKPEMVAAYMAVQAC
ncbi:long-chain fatty acid--CoA ligase, partial [bacterium 1xD42-87]